MLLGLIVAIFSGGWAVPTEHLVWSDDFNYANVPALEAAYTTVFTVDPITPGPTGYATGCTSQHVADVALAGNFELDNDKITTPLARYFHVRGVYELSYTDDFNSGSALMQMQQHLASLGYYSKYWQVNLRKSDNAIQLVVNGTTYPTASYTSAYTAGLVTPGAANRIDVFGYLSTLADAGGGLYAPNTDGEITLQVNDVTAFTFTGKVWNFEDTLPELSWNYVRIFPSGTFSGLRVWDEAAAAAGGSGRGGYPLWQSSPTSIAGAGSGV